MKAIVVASLLGASVASAGPYDRLVASDPFRTEARAAVVVLPDADGLHTSVADDNIVAPPTELLSGAYGIGDQESLHVQPSWAAGDVR